MADLMNALRGVGDFLGRTANPQVFEAARSDRNNRRLGNALSQGDYAGATDMAFRQGNIGAGLDLAQYQQGQAQMQQEQQAAQRQKQAQGTLSLFKQMEAPQISQMAFEQPDRFQEITGMTPDEYMQLGQSITQSGRSPEEFRQYVIQQAMAELGQMPERVEGKVVNDRLVDPYSGNVMGDYSDPEKPDYETFQLGNTMYSGVIGQPDTYTEMGPAPVKGPLATTNVYSGTDGGAYKSLSDVPVGQPIPPALLPFPESKIPEDTYYVRTEDGQGFEAVAVPGSAAEAKKVARDDSSTIDTLINDYATLASNKAIPARNNSAVENIGAMYSGSPFGRKQDEIGGEYGNIDNAEARKNIEGLSMNALMKMISMSDVSARAMDSDAEMRAWLTAIKSDNYESALTKLHVLDKSFGSGTALQRAFEDGIIDQDTYQWVTRRVDTDPYTQRMQQKAQRYAQLGGAIGADNMTQSEGESVNDLLEFMTPEERALFEGQQ